MKRWTLPAGAAGPDDLRLDEVPVPEPGTGEVRIRVEAVSVNARDQLILSGPFGRLPGRELVPLSDVAGTIDAVGDGVRGLSVGTRVTNLHFAGWEDGPPPAEGTGLGLGALEEDGVLAERVVLPATRVALAPAHLDAAEAATIPVAGVTAWNALFGAHPAGAGDRVLTIGSGGVSLFALQLALAVGAEVHAVARNPVTGERLRALGASSFATIDGNGDWGADVARRSGGVDKVVDTIGVGALSHTMAALRPSGEVAVLGLFDLDSGAVDADVLLAKQAKVRGIAVGSQRMHRDLVAFLERHAVRPIIHRRLAFDDAPAAFRAQATPGVFGKVVVELA